MIFCYVGCKEYQLLCLLAWFVCLCMCAYACSFAMVMMILNELAKQKWCEKYKTDTSTWFMYNS